MLVPHNGRGVNSIEMFAPPRRGLSMEPKLAPVRAPQARELVIYDIKICANTYILDAYTTWLIIEFVQTFLKDFIVLFSYRPKSLMRDMRKENDA